MYDTQCSDFICVYESFPECLHVIPECLIVKMSNPKMSNEMLSDCQLKKYTL